METVIIFIWLFSLKYEEIVMDWPFLNLS